MNITIMEPDLFKIKNVQNLLEPDKCETKRGPPRSDDGLKTSVPCQGTLSLTTQYHIIPYSNKGQHSYLSQSGKDLRLPLENLHSIPGTYDVQQIIQHAHITKQIYPCAWEIIILSFACTRMGDATVCCWGSVI